ncbi:hypothetical protein ACFX5Q_34150 [Mesorhizobium sp. IMUNJ 23033]|uniref:hypothetical protein n=1 Tax=Mesorhizobium sp. IMUNJ 23033 TaxID=3378039 RepID=UPI00384FD0A6
MSGQEQTGLDQNVEARPLPALSALYQCRDFIHGCVEWQRNRLEFRRIGLAHTDAVIGNVDDPIAGGRLFLPGKNLRKNPSQLIEPPVEKIQELRVECHNQPPATRLILGRGLQIEITVAGVTGISARALGAD